MTKAAKLLESARRNPKNLRFAELQSLLVGAGFTLKRISGSHHVYTRADVEEIVNVQPRGKDAKPYQVRQLLDIIDKYRIEIG